MQFLLRQLSGFFIWTTSASCFYNKHFPVFIFLTAIQNDCWQTSNCNIVWVSKDFHLTAGQLTTFSQGSKVLQTSMGSGVNSQMIKQLGPIGDIHVTYHDFITVSSIHFIFDLHFTLYIFLDIYSPTISLFTEGIHFHNKVIPHSIGIRK